MSDRFIRVSGGPVKVENDRPHTFVPAFGQEMRKKVKGGWSIVCQCGRQMSDKLHKEGE